MHHRLKLRDRSVRRIYTPNASANLLRLWCPGFVPNRTIKPKPLPPPEGNWLWRPIMALAQHSVPVMWSV